MESPSFTAAGGYTREDYFEAVTEVTKRALKRHAKVVRDWKGFFRMIPYIVLVAVGMAILTVMELMVLELKSVAMALALVACALGMVLYRQRRILYLLPMEGGTFLRHHANTINSEGFSQTSPVSSMHVQWQGLFWVEETKHLLLLYVDRNLAFYIPKRLFADEAEWKACLAYIQEKITNSHPAP